METHLPQDPVFGPLVVEERLMSLGPGTPNTAARALLDRLDIVTAFGAGKLRDRTMAEACFAGVWLYHDFLDESHRISQSISTPTGSYWHAILHRREPDSWNSKYWFGRVGRHPVFADLREAARRLAAETQEIPETHFLRDQREWNPFAFVDLCEASRLGRVPAESLCRRIQLLEWQLLFTYCYRHARETADDS